VEKLTTSPLPRHSLAAPVVAHLERFAAETARVPAEISVIDVGCGRGKASAIVRERGFQVLGFDVAEDRISEASANYPSIRFDVFSGYENIRERYGPQDAIVSFEVVEHLYDPAAFAARVHEALKPGGLMVLTTPYHGYFKNLAISLLNQWDDHHMSLRLHSHIKFFSPRTVRTLLETAGFTDLRFGSVGRIPGLAKSMVVAARHP